MTTTSYSVFKQKFKKTIADAIYNEVISKTSTYYHWFGKENPWTDFLSPFIPSSTGDYPGQPSDNFRYELHVRRDILTAKKIKPSDVSYVVKRIDWTYNTVYDMYDDAYSTTSSNGANVVGYYGAVRLEDSLFYVITSDYNVYKCLDNNNNAKSTVMPVGTGTTPFFTSDGYKWKFMYTIPVSLRNKFLSATYMPVTTALNSNFYSNGDINKIIVQSGGKGYNPATTTAVVTGNGYLEGNPYVLTGVTIADAGSGYTGGITLTVSPPFESYITWSANLAVPVGSYIKYTNLGVDNFYYVVSGTQLGSSGPVHTDDAVRANGSCQLKYVGTTATAGATLSGDHVDTAALVGAGYGYQGTPAASITVSAPVPADATWTASTLMVKDKVIKSGTRYYQVTVQGVSGTSAPTHTSGAMMNGAAELTFVAKDAIIVPTQTKTEAQISLANFITPGVTSVYTNLMTYHGTKYTEIPSVTFSAPPSGTTAIGVIDALSNNGVYIIRMTEVGSGYASAPTVTITSPVKTFNAATDVNGTLEYITYNGHKLVTGDAVVYTNGGGTSVGGLTTTHTYYVIKIDANNIQLADSLLHAQAGTPLNISAGVGSAHKLTMVSGAATATAVLGTGGEIFGCSIVNGGVGYSIANITIVDTSGSGSGAELDVDFSTGNVNTLQANVELLAIPGTIEAIKVVTPGSGYGAATVNILGDGTGATAEAVCSGGKVVAINITNPGRDYSWTDVQIIGNNGNDGTASVRAIMSPLGGHGSNAIDELNANSLAFYTSISKDKNQGIEINNDYRKVGLVRNFKKHGQNVKFTDDVGSGCVLVTAQFDKTKLQHDMLLLKDGYKKYRVVDFNDTQILLSVFNNFSVNIGDLLVTDPTDGGLTTPTIPSQNIVVTSVTERTIDQFSGDFLMFSVREPYSPTAEQIITVRTVLTV